MDMVERVATAIGLRSIERGHPVDSVVVLELARAAIEAMREPTDKIWDAMDRSYQSPACMWMAGIDAALKKA